MKEENRPIWAPWRIEYIRALKDDVCFLCQNLKNKDKDEENLIINRGTNCFVMLNRFPYNSGHLMIAPYRHIGDISDLKKEERYEIMDLTVMAKELLKKAMQPEGFNIGFNLGPAAGAGLKDHIHLHIVPRWVGDVNFMPVLADIKVVPESLKETAELLRKVWT